MIELEKNTVQNFISNHYRSISNEMYYS
jgi:hypothetical protein